jgi:hypothetical protein
MLSELNGQENYFTRISTAGLLNVRKIELTQMLLQDINIFHTHPNRMPDANLDTSRLIASAIASMELNDKRAKISINLKESSGITLNKSMISLTTATTPTLTASTNLNCVPCRGSNSALSRSSNNLTLTKANSGSPILSKSPSLRISRNELSSSSQLLSKPAQNQTFVVATNDEMVTSLNDMSSFQLYATNRPTNFYHPIREQLPFAPNLTTSPAALLNEPRTKHKVSYLKLDDNPSLDFNALQNLHNGFTFVCVFNEWDMQQSNYLLNIRLEADNSTLIWSRPAWDINNTWINSGITGNVGTTSERSSEMASKSGNQTVSEAARFT